jgi:trehalose synthase-fused probable maltokinase
VSALPTLRVAEPRQALDLETLGSIDPAHLARWVSARRWFGAKGAEPGAMRIAATVPFEWDGGSAVFAVLEVDLGEGRTDRYQLPLAVSAGEGERPLARVELPDRAGALVDAAEVPEFRAALARALASGASAGGDGLRWHAEPVGAAAAELGAEPERSSVGSAEQSNTSIIYDEHAIVKLFRRLEVGVNPDVEIGRFLARSEFAHTPRLLATARLESAAGSCVAAIAQTLVPGATDAWHHALEQGRPYFAAPGDRPAANPFAMDAEQLGRVTRELHEALAADPNDPEFRPLPARREDVELWATLARRAIEEGVTLLERQVAAGTLAAKWHAEARGIIERREAYLRNADARAAAVGEHGGLLVRHHGDYHLGQVLRSGGGEFIVIDFEGEPARPLAERRERRSALRDVAGMLRSFAYVASALQLECRGRVDEKLLDMRAARWERAARDAFLLGYLGAGDAPLPPFLPDTRDRAEKLIALFETEKLFYELAYELNSRPAWVGIPLRGIYRMLPA